MKLFLLKENDFYDMTPIVSRLSWESDVDSLSTILALDLGIRKGPGMPLDLSNRGDKFLLTNDQDQKILQGICTNKIKTGAYNATLQVKDIAFYLNKSEMIYQFNSMRGEDAIKKVLSDFGINANIPPLNIIVDDIFPAHTPNYIINYIINQYNKVNEVPYRWRINSEGNFEMFKRGSIIKKLQFKPANNLAYVDSNKLIDANSNVTETLENLYNSVKIAYLDDNKVKEVKTYTDQASINNFGKLQKVFSISKEDIAKAKREAEVFLKKSLKLEKVARIQTLISDVVIQAGDCVNLSVETLELNGLYEVEKITNEYTNGIHRAILTLREVL